MRLTDIPAALIEEIVRTWRRRLIAGAAILIFAILAISEAISALRIALHVEIGPVYARLIMTGLFIAIALLVAVTLMWRERRARRIRAARAKEPFGGEERVGAIAEAISLGYSLAQDFRRGRSKEEAPSESTATTDADAAPERETARN